MNYILNKVETGVHLMTPGQNFLYKGEVWLVLQGGSKTRCARLSDGKVKMLEYPTKVTPLVQVSKAEFTIDQLKLC